MIINEFKWGAYIREGSAPPPRRKQILQIYFKTPVCNAVQPIYFLVKAQNFDVSLRLTKMLKCIAN